MTRPATQWLRLRWPHEVGVEHARAALLGLNGLSTPRRRDAFLLMAVGSAGIVSHFSGGSNFYARPCVGQASWTATPATHLSISKENPVGGQPAGWPYERPPFPGGAHCCNASAVRYEPARAPASKSAPTGYWYPSAAS